MQHRNFALTAAAIFLILGVVHLIRVVSGWEVVVNGKMIAMWPSWVAIVITLSLAYSGFRLSKK